jgi:UDP-N-acetylmuramoyl-tripeptide--D-alanyl-D-alanine ligase
VVIGSYGKSTTTAAVAAVLGRRVAWPPPGNADTDLALPVLGLLPWQRHAVIEVGIDRKGQMIDYALMLRPDIVVVTSIGSEHSQSLGTLEEIRDEKALMLRGLREGGTVVLNGDDPHVLAMAASTHGRVVTFGFGTDNDVRADEPRLDWPHGTRLTVHVGGAVHELQVRLLGRTMMYPILAAVAVAWVEGRPLAGLAAALEAVAPRPGRMQPVRLPNGAWVIRDEFKAPVESIEAALDVLASVPGRRIVVLGEIDAPPGSKRPHYRRVGERLAAVASRVIVVGGNDAHRSYAVGAVRAGLARSDIQHVGRSWLAAAQAVQADLRPGDVVLIKGQMRQRLERVALALQGRTVGCHIDQCGLVVPRCERCPVLATGASAGDYRPPPYTPPADACPAPSYDG